jgi:hypothetical protein
MKRKIIFFITLLTIFGLITMQSCKKEAAVAPVAVLAAMPASPVPTVDAIIPFTGTGQTINLTWSGTATNAINWDVYFGTSASPDLAASGVTANSYNATITKGGTYYWQVSTTDANKETTTSPVWSFEVNSNPNVPALTAPANNATAVSNTAALKWTCTDPEGDDLTFDVYFGTTATPGAVASGITALTYSPTMDYNTTYYWKIVAHDPYGGTSTSAVNSFKTDVFHPNFAVFNGIFSEVVPDFSASAKHDVFLQVNTTTHVIIMYLPLADGMVAAGWGTQYFGAHPISITYDPVTFAVTSTKQLWTDSFIDPKEMGPMSLTVSSGTIDATNKKISIKWIMSGDAYWGPDYTTGTCTYTLRVQK